MQLQLHSSFYQTEDVQKQTEKVNYLTDLKRLNCSEPAGITPISYNQSGFVKGVQNKKDDKELENGTLSEMRSSPEREIIELVP